jgi:chemotaxis protein CheD
MHDAALQQLARYAYFDRNFSCDAVRILPGEYYFTGKDIMLTTVLGSCVAACIQDRISGIGGMNHFLLPDNGGDTDADSPVSDSMRYGSFAMEVLINNLLKSGARRCNLVAKVFGGGNVLPGMTTLNVGARNAQFVLRYLKTDNIPVLSEDLEDRYPRKVCFFPATGKVMVKKLKENRDANLIRQELNYTDSLKLSRSVGEIDLFDGDRTAVMQSAD